MWIVLMLATMAVIFVNGWTDAPGAIANAVVTGSLSYRRAAALAAVCNLLGAFAAACAGDRVAARVEGLIGFSGEPPQRAVVALTGALLSIVLFAVAAWRWGIPTSESHALLAALAGASLALDGGLGGMNRGSLSAVLWGLAGAVALGYAGGWLVQRLYRRWFARAGNRFLDRAQIVGAAAMSLMHGAQDGQKFAAVLLVAGRLAGTQRMPGRWLALALCAATMALGTLLGGERIIRRVGRDMVRIDRLQGFAADTAGAASLFLLSALGIPVSTTHTKTAALLGVSGAAGAGRTNYGVFGEMVLAWVITFPVCGALAWGLVRTLLALTGL